MNRMEEGKGRIRQEAPFRSNRPSKSQSLPELQWRDGKEGEKKFKKQKTDLVNEGWETEQV